MRRYLRSKLLVVAFAGTALLATLGGSVPASAHEFEASRTITIHRRPRGVVDPGTRVRFFGRIISDRHSCENFELVELIRVGRGVVARDISDSEGNYSMRKRVFRTGRYFSRVITTISGRHPHRHVCLAAQSRTIRVRVD
ncbi:MAG TPA: hypothetical protein VGT06_09655 [Candidatus Methylomirabilis sp.]|nr:hypothetical protein [Candidatus Methylomirabilis sp.]